jgi:hypothetical protein
MGQQQTKEDNMNYQNYKPNPPINQHISKQPSNNTVQQTNTYQQPQMINQVIHTGQNIRPQHIPDNRPKYKGGTF